MKCKICGGRTKIWYENLFDDRHGYPGHFKIKKCVDCGFAQTEPQIPPSKIPYLYKNYYPRQNLNLDKIIRSDFKTPDRFLLWRKGLLANAHWWVKPKSMVLDVGSGVGYSLLYLSEIGCTAYGVDPDENAKAFARKFELNFHHGFIEDSPFKNKSFDYVTASQVLEHTNNPESFLRECKKRLNEKGKIILSFPNSESLTRKLLGKKWLHWHLPYHLNHFNKKSVYLLADKVGMKIEKIFTVTPNMWTNIQIRRLLQKPKIGERDTFWDGAFESKSKASIIEKSWFKKIVLFLEEYNFVNRLVDIFGLGESFVVILKTS